MEVIENVFLCGICGSTHQSTKCPLIPVSDYIPDKKIPSKARLTLPQTMKIEIMADGTFVAATQLFIKKGTQFGPFVARKTFSLNPSTIFPLKVFCTGNEDFCEYYLDTSDENECNWMYFIQPANNSDEQNLVCFQENESVYYISSKDISEGETLKVWYAPYYAQKMNKGLLKPDQTYENRLKDIDLNKLLTKQQNIVERDNWTCKFCGIVERNVIKFANHIIEHYRLQLRKVCEICRAVFGTHKGLKKHLNIVHSSNGLAKTTDSRLPDKQPSTKQKEIVKIKESVIGGPLLNDILTDSLDNSNLILHQTEINNFDLNNIENQNILVESDNLNVDNLLTDNVKGFDHFNFELDETQEQFICDVCLKAFTKLRLLILHLRKHTGRYTCPHCLTIFCRNENLKSHACINSQQRSYKCDACKKVFTQRKYLSRHILAVHKRKHRCSTCGKNYYSPKELKEHNCSKIPENEKQKFSCMMCNKFFLRESYLKNHMKVHSSKPVDKRFVKTETKTTGSICEICAQSFENKHSLYEHSKSHKEPVYFCRICDKKFHRKNVFTNHVMTHGPPQFKCEICKKEFKLKKYLNSHIISHETNQTWQCTSCPRIFKDRSNFLKHQRNAHSQECHICKKVFSSKQLKNQHALEHLDSYYACFFCNKIFKLRASLMRHMKKKHSEQAKDLDTTKIQPVSVARTENTNQSNHDEATVNIDTQDFANISFDQNIGDCDIDKSKDSVSIIDFNDFDVDLNTSFDLHPSINNQEVCLSMPDLENEQEITFGQNAYMLENGNVIEPQAEGKVVVYVLDQKFKS